MKSHDIYGTFTEQPNAEESIFCRPLSFNQLFAACKEKLTQLFLLEFKRDKVFKDIYFEICQAEIRETFLRRTKFLKTGPAVNQSN